MGLRTGWLFSIWLGCSAVDGPGSHLELLTYIDITDYIDTFLCHVIYVCIYYVNTAPFFVSCCYIYIYIGI